jgi:sulfonate transport system substrate-binding protein
VIRTFGRIGVAGALAFGTLAGMALSATGEDLPKDIRISTGAGSPFGKPFSSANSGLAAARQAVEQEFANDGVTVTWQHLKGGGPASNEALANGSIDIGYAGEFPAIFGRAGGLKTRFVGGGFRGNNAYLYVAPSSTVKDVAELKGRKIAIRKGQPWEYGFDNLLRSRGLKQSDVQVLNLSVPDARTALERGDIDAFYDTSSSFNFTTDGVAKIIWSTRDAPRDWLYVADFFVADEFAKTYPTAVTRFLKAIVRTSQSASDPANAPAVYETWAQTGFPLDNFRREYAGTDLKFRFSPIPDEFLITHYKKAAAYMYDNKLIRRPVDVDTWVDRSFVDSAIKQLGLVGFWPEYDQDGAAKITKASN